MSDNNLLSNPTPQDFDNNQEQVEVEENTNSKDQLAFNIETPNYKVKRSISNAKMKLRRRSEFMEVSMLWKSPALPFAITSLIAITIVLIIGGIINFNLIPPEIPFFYNSIEKRWEQIDKTIIFLFPVFLLVVELIIINFNISIFRFDRRLSTTINWVMVFLNILLFIMISRIYSLIV